MRYWHAIAALVGGVLLTGALVAPSEAAAGAVPAPAAPAAASVVTGPPPPTAYWRWLCGTSRYSLPRLVDERSSYTGTRLAQYSLRYLGYRVGPVDGRYGAQTRSAVRAFQRYWWLVVDGKVGPQTWGKLQDRLCWE